jgi:hypothetical protein
LSTAYQLISAMVRLRAARPRIRGSIPSTGKIRPVLGSIGSWYRGSSPRVKQPGRDADLSPLSSAKVKNEWTSILSVNELQYVKWTSE